MKERERERGEGARALFYDYFPLPRSFSFLPPLPLPASPLSSSLGGLFFCFFLRFGRSAELRIFGTRSATRRSAEYLEFNDPRWERNRCDAAMWIFAR